MCRPTTENIEAKIDAGTVKVHPTRQPITKKLITNAMGTCNAGYFYQVEPVAAGTHAHKYV